jgi:hypothetical protein
MLETLKLHPDSRCEAVTEITVAVARPQPGLLALRYTVAGRIAGLRLPPAIAPMRADELWQTTCFEAFVRTAPEAGYYEFNLAPSTRWAAYHFNAYREGMALAEIAPPHIIVGVNDTHFDLETLIALPVSATDWRVGLSAVIEETNGEKSYWALAHPPGKPDFHHGDSFALDLAAEQA